MSEPAPTDLPRIYWAINALEEARPALFLHPATAPTITLSRLANLMTSAEPAVTEASLFEAVRGDLWCAASEPPRAWFDSFPKWMWLGLDVAGEVTDRRLRREHEAFQEKLLSQLPEAFSLVEEAIELERRLEGFATELDFVSQAGLSLAQWQALPLRSEAGEGALDILAPCRSELYETVAADGVTWAPS